MKKQYRVLNLTINKDDLLGLKTLIAELSEVENKNMFGIPLSPYLFGVKSGQIFVIIPDSNLGKYLINDPKNIKTLNLTDFEKGTINLREGQKDAYYQIDYLNLKASLLSNDINPNFYYYADEAKPILAEYYLKTKFSDSYDNGRNISDTIIKLKEGISIKPQHKNIAWEYFNLAELLTITHDFEGAKENFLKSAMQDTVLKADAYFALGCLKTKLGEDSNMELQKAIQLYEKDKNEYSKFALELINRTGSIVIWDKFKLSGEKLNGQLSAKLDEGDYSYAQIETSFKVINNFINSELRYADLQNRPDGFFEIEVSFIDGESAPHNCISLCEISGLDFDEFRRIISKIESQIH